MKRLIAVNQLRPKIVSQNIVDHEAMSGRMSKNTTYNAEEIYGILRMYTKDILAALQAGETVKIDGVLTLVPNMKVGGEVDLALRGDRGATAALNNPTLWTADKVSNHANLGKDADALVAQWNKDHPDDPVTD
ncbi:MAG: hypothetical protein WA821_19250 [Anaerolineales bacterium]